MKIRFLLCALLNLALCVTKAQTFDNPILAGFYPDPSICRVGNDYYITTSTFAYFPGLPIFHSTDLVNWKQIGNAMNREEQLDQSNAGGIAWVVCSYYPFSQGNLLYTLHIN